MTGGFGWLDTVVLVGYFLGITAFGLWMARRTRTSDGFFRGERKLSWWIMVGQAFGTGTHAEMPVAQAGALTELCRLLRATDRPTRPTGAPPARRPGPPRSSPRESEQQGRQRLSVVLFSGYTLAELRAMGPAVPALLAPTDLLVDGRYARTRPEARRRWVGSANQALHFLSDRYSPDDPAFAAPNTVEIRFAKGSLDVNGWPALAAALSRGAR